MKVRASTDWKMRNLPILASLLVKSISLKMFNSVMMMMIIMISMMEVSDSSCPPLLHSYFVCYNGEMLTVCCRSNIFLLSSISLTIGIIVLSSSFPLVLQNYVVLIGQKLTLCSQMPIAFYHSVIHGLGFFIC